MDRRQFLSGIAGAAMTLKRGSAAGFQHALGFQLYTIRDLIASGPRSALKTLADAGYTEVEVLQDSFEKIAPMLSEMKLNAVSEHITTGQILKSSAPSDDWKKTVETAHKAGLQYLVFPYLAPAERGGLDVMKKLADKLNAAGELSKSAGIPLAYHNHAFEFQKFDGTRLIDAMMANLDPKLVNLEFDVFWSSVAGVDPLTVFAKYPGRIPLVHLKDKAKEQPAAYTEDQVPHGNYREIGGGFLNIAAILKAAEKAGTRHYFVEQDYCPGDPVQSLRQSYQYLRKLEVK